MKYTNCFCFPACLNKAMFIHILFNAWKGVLSKVFGLRGGRVAGDRINLHGAEIYNFCFSQTITRLINGGGWDGRCLCDVWGRKMHTELWWGILKETGQLEHLGVGRAVTLKNNAKNEAGSAFCGLICVWIGTSGGLLNTLMKCVKSRKIWPTAEALATCETQLHGVR
jgi:hypothetical protein